MIQVSRLAWAVVLGSLLVTCTLAPGPGARQGTLTSLGSEALDELPLVPRLVLAGLPSIRPDDLWLVRGRISDKERTQILAAAPGEALAERRLALSAWASELGIVIAPLVVLEPSQDYSVVALGTGEVGRVTTGPTQSPIWRRWNAGQPAPGGWVVYCASEPPWALEDRAALAIEGDAPAMDLGAHVIEPGGEQVEVLAGFSDDTLAQSAPGERSPSCVRFRAPARGRTVLPPHQVAGRYFEPAPLVIQVADDVPAGGEVQVRVLGSAAFLELPPGLAEISRVSAEEDAANGGFEGEAKGPVLRTSTLARASVPLGQFTPGRHMLAVTRLDEQGELDRQTLAFDVGEARGYPVVSEVLANPLGPEPESEWVEIVNVGRAPLALAGYVLEDAGGETDLPDVTLPAGGVGLLVRRDFLAAASGDVVPAADAIPVPVDELGESGLSNSGEAIRLRAPDGAVLSEVPALPAAAGRSVTRRHLLAPDWVTSFGAHAPPGASPGSENELDAP